MKSLNEDLKTGQFKQVYLLYGEESYLKKQYKDRLSKAMLPEGDTMNYAYYEGKGTDVKQVIDLAETLPFFAPRRLIVMEDTGFFKGASPELSEYIRSMPETACFLFVESEVDKRGKLYKAVKEKGRIVEMTRQDGATLQKWVLSMIQKEGKQITQSAVRFFLTKVGDDMENIHGELEKLFCYTIGRTEITIHDMEDICTTHIDNQIFEMIHAVAEKRQKQALLYYYDLLALKEPPMRILFLMVRQFRILMEVSEMSRRGYGKKEISEHVKIPPFAVGKYLAQAQKFSIRKLRQILEDCAGTEEEVKTGKLADTMAVELLIMQYSS